MAVLDFMLAGYLDLVVVVVCVRLVVEENRSFARVWGCSTHVEAWKQCTPHGPDRKAWSFPRPPSVGGERRTRLVTPLEDSSKDLLLLSVWCLLSPIERKGSAHVRTPLRKKMRKWQG